MNDLDDRAMRELAHDWGFDPDDPKAAEWLRGTYAFAAKRVTIAYSDVLAAWRPSWWPRRWWPERTVQ